MERKGSQKEQEEKRHRGKRGTGQVKWQRNCQKAGLGGKFRHGQAGERLRRRGRQGEIRMC